MYASSGHLDSEPIHVAIDRRSEMAASGVFIDFQRERAAAAHCIYRLRMEDVICITRHLNHLRD